MAIERGTVFPGRLHTFQPGARVAVSVITVSELLHGYFRARPRSRKLARERFIRSLLADLEILPVDLPVAREHARTWADLAERGESVGAYDLLIAATAIAHQAPLATLNVREFRRVKGLRILAVAET